jgi:hypothetical protein
MHQAKECLIPTFIAYSRSEIKSVDSMVNTTTAICSLLVIFFSFQELEFQDTHSQYPPSEMNRLHLSNVTSIKTGTSPHVHCCGTKGWSTTWQSRFPGNVY